MKVTKRRFWYVVAAKVEFELECGHIVEHFYRDPEKGRNAYRKQIQCKACIAEVCRRQINFAWGKKDGTTASAVDAGQLNPGSDPGSREET